jgi:phosphomannomutase
LADYIKPYQKYFSSGEINLKVANALEKIAQLKEKFSDGKINELDGLSVEYPQVWFNVRMSNTEPLLRVSVEGVSKEAMEEKKEEILSCING